MANGYFQTEIRSEGSYVILYPPTDGGKPIRFEELEKYLISNKMTEFKKVDLKQACDTVAQSGKTNMVRVGASLPYRIREEMVVYISEDKMKLTCRFYAPSVKGETMDPDEIVRQIQANGIKYGIDNVAIRNFVMNRQYCTDFIFAQGKAYKAGHDASVEYFFNTNTSLKPAMNEDGTVDYKNLDNISHVTEGQLLARITPADPGQTGMDLFANVIKPPSVKTRKLNTGNNIRMSEDGLEIYSTVMGHANLVGGQVFVSDIYEINVTGHKGFITGGHIQAGSKLSAKKIGSPMGAHTVVEVGMSPESKERYNTLKSEILSLSAELNKAYPILQTFMDKLKAGEKLPPKNMLYLKQLAAQTKDMEAKIKERKGEFEMLDAEMSLNINSSVEVQGIIYPGVEINIANCRTITDSERNFCKFVAEAGEIKVKNL
ncbi:MAG: DUF342 domain-containing protein [Lachnospiraceae bacterium]|nr:DUF342 domain-containing protein [Lachnospiraceae bacterium]